MGWLYVGLSRKEWQAMPGMEAKLDLLEAALSPHVAVRRRPLEALPLLGPSDGPADC